MSSTNQPRGIVNKRKMSIEKKNTKFQNKFNHTYANRIFLTTYYITSVQLKESDLISLNQQISIQFIQHNIKQLNTYYTKKKYIHYKNIICAHFLQEQQRVNRNIPAHVLIRKPSDENPQPCIRYKYKQTYHTNTKVHIFRMKHANISYQSPLSDLNGYGNNIVYPKTHHKPQRPLHKLSRLKWVGYTKDINTKL